MNRSLARNMFRKILIPVIHGCDFKESLRVATSIASTESILLAGIVRVSDDSSLSGGALPAQELRKSLRQIKVPGDVHEVVPLADGHLLITCGDGHKVIELDANEKVVWELNENDLPGHPRA